VEVQPRKDSVAINFYGIYTGATVLRDVQNWLESGEDGKAVLILRQLSVDLIFVDKSLLNCLNVVCYRAA